MVRIHFYLKAILFSFGGIFLLLYLLNFLFLAPPRDFIEGKIVSIEEGSSLRSISKDLKEQNIIKSRVVFESLVIAFGGEKHLLPGDYFFEQKLTVYQIAQRMSFGKRNLAPIKVTIPEGFSVSDIAIAMSEKLPNFNQENFLKLASPQEGYLFPDTYFFFKTDNEQDVLNLMSENFKKKFAPMSVLIESLGKNEKDIIIMASIIEREAKGDVDRGIISGILWKRISINMPLQVDAAPITYKIKGLPESPIANPGLLAILATIYPESSPYLFYLHGNDGNVYYAKTFAEHRQNKIKYLR